jgi:competence protein ComEC
MSSEGGTSGKGTVREKPVHGRKPCLYVFLCAVAGIFLSERFPCCLPVAVVAAVCFGIAAFAERRLIYFSLLVVTVFFIRHELDWRRAPGRLPNELVSQGVSLVHVTGVVTSDPVAAGYALRTAHYRFRMDVSDVMHDGEVVRAGFPVEVTWAGEPPVWGDEVTMAAAISPIPAARNPGEFDEAATLAREGVFAELSCDYPSDHNIVAHGRGNWLIGWGRGARAMLERRLSLGIDDDPEISGLVETITLGLKQETPIADRELFQQVGALHLFVVNGLHVALLAGILGFMLKPFGIYRRAFALVIIPILFAYALLTGLSPGSVRAAIMAAVIFGASFVDRRPFSLNTLAAAGLILLLWDTNELFKVGFQFSFGVVASIILLARLIEKPILPVGLPDPFLPRQLWTRWQRAGEFGWQRVSGLAAVSIAASVGSFPFTAGYFNLVTPTGFLANLLLVPLADCILAESMFSILFFPAPAVSVLFNNTNWLIASAMLRVVHFFAMVPGGHFFVSTSSAPAPECRVTVLDLGPGQATVIESEGAVWLVDCGNASSYGRIVYPYLESRGVNRLDGLILTHGSSSSIGAAREVISDFAPREIYESSVTDRSPTRRVLQSALEDGGRPKTIVETGDQLQISSAVNCSVLFPPAGFDGRTASDKSLVLQIQDGRERVLLMSDSAFTGEQWLLENDRDLRAAVVVIDGESSDVAGTDEFVSAVRPVVVIRGEPGYGGTASKEREWAAGIYGHGVTPLLQSATGAVMMDLTGTGVTVSGFMNGQRVKAD